MKGEIVLYQPDDQSDFHLEVKVENETVWLTQAQMVELFNSTKQNISLHIKNIFNEEDLDENSTVKDSLTVQKEGSRKVKRKVLSYNFFSLINNNAIRVITYFKEKKYTKQNCLVINL